MVTAATMRPRQCNDQFSRNRVIPKIRMIIIGINYFTQNKTIIKIINEPFGLDICEISGLTKYNTG